MPPRAATFLATSSSAVMACADAATKNADATNQPPIQPKRIRMATPYWFKVVKTTTSSVPELNKPPSGERWDGSHGTRFRWSRVAPHRAYRRRIGNFRPPTDLCPMMISATRRLTTAVMAFAALSSLPALAQTAADATDGLNWRLVGPMRAGWSTVAKGIADQPDTYYFGAHGGGVWKTTDSGATWKPVFDSVPAASVGALAIAPSDANTIYVGTGEVAARYDIAAGSGVYKSTDGGKSWNSVGLAATRHIGAIEVDPRNAGHVLVAALGHYFGPNRERGVFRSEDGGKTWQQTLFIDADTGTVDLAADPANPDIVYAAAWQVRNYPWLSYFQPNAGPGSGVYRSADGGKTWSRIAGNGWPTAPALGRIGLATAAGGRVYAVINAAPHSGNIAHAASENQGGLYLSLIHISEPTRLLSISYAVFCLK